MATAVPHPPSLATDEHGLRIRVLGPLEVVVDGAPLVVDTRKALAVVAILAIENRAFARDELAALLWPDADDASARGALRRTLSVLRAGLGDRWVLIARTTVGLDHDQVSLDLTDLEEAARSAGAEGVSGALALARGPFLAGFSLRDSPEFDDWRATTSVMVERRVQGALDRLVETAESAGQIEVAIKAAASRLEMDTLDEPARRRLMMLFARAGDRAGAIRTYRSGVATLESELGVAPLTETTQLYEAIRDDRLRTPGPEGPVSGGPSAPLLGRPGSLPLVGREAALGRILAAHAAARDSGGVAAIVGEAGIGKTRLGDAAIDVVRAGGGTAISARAYPSETSIAYAPIVELLRVAFGLPGAAERLATLHPASVGELQRLVPLPIGVGSPAPVPTTSPEGARIRLLEAVSAALLAIASTGTGPGILRVEDLQWADEASREALAYMARRLSGQPVLLVVTWRMEDLDERGRAFARLVDELPTASVVRLARLDRVAVAELVTAVMGDDGTPSGLADALFEDSEGLPLYIVEALALSQGSGPTVAARSVRALLQDRLATVSEMAGQVLIAAAVIGRSFEFGMVRAASGRSEEETVEALDELVSRGLVREAGIESSGVRYDFAHAKLRDAAYEAASLARRRLLHGRIAHLLRTESGRSRDHRLLALVARHEQEAGRSTEAAEAYAEAGFGARAVYANREAIENLERALALGHPETAELQRSIGELEMAAGRYGAAISTFEAAAASASPRNLPAIELLLGRVHARRGDLGTAASHLDAALAGLDAGDATNASLRARILVERSTVAHRAGDEEGAREASSAALALAQETNDTLGEGIARRLVGLIAFERGDLVTARRELSWSVQLSDAADDPADGIAARNALALAEAAAGRRDTAMELLGVALEACRRIGDRHLAAAVENNLADQLHAIGQGDAALDHLKHAVSIFAEVGGGRDEPEPEIWKLVTW